MATETNKRPVEKEITFPELSPEEQKQEEDICTAFATSARVMGETPPIIWMHGKKKDDTGEEIEEIFASTDKKMGAEGRYFCIAQGTPGFTIDRISYWLDTDMMGSVRIYPMKLTEKDDKLFISAENKSEGIMKHLRHIIHGSGKILFNKCIKEQIEAERKKNQKKA